MNIEDHSISDSSDNEPESEMEKEILHNAITKLDGTDKLTLNLSEFLYEFCKYVQKAQIPI